MNLLLEMRTNLAASSAQDYSCYAQRDLSTLQVANVVIASLPHVVDTTFVAALLGALTQPHTLRSSFRHAVPSALKGPVYSDCVSCV